MSCTNARVPAGHAQVIVGGAACSRAHLLCAGGVHACADVEGAEAPAVLHDALVGETCRGAGAEGQGPQCCTALRSSSTEGKQPRQASE
jgi:hypothetical protein